MQDPPDLIWTYWGLVGTCSVFFVNFHLSEFISWALNTMHRSLLYPTEDVRIVPTNHWKVVRFINPLASGCKVKWGEEASLGSWLETILLKCICGHSLPQTTNLSSFLTGCFGVFHAGKYERISAWGNMKIHCDKCRTRGTENPKARKMLAVMSLIFTALSTAAIRPSCSGLV